MKIATLVIVLVVAAMAAAPGVPSAAQPAGPHRLHAHGAREAGGVAGPPSSPPAVGDCSATSDCEYLLDDGAHENAIGLTGGGLMFWANPFTVRGDCVIITSVRVGWGPLATPPAAARLFVYDDPDDDGDPVNAVLLAPPTEVTTANEDAVGVLNDYPLDVPVVVSGVFFVGVSLDHPDGDFPAAIDQTASAGMSWVAFGIGNPDDPLNAPGLLAIIDTLGGELAGNWMVRACGLNTCLGDVDLDGAVGVQDLLQVVTNPGPCGECPEDLDNDGQVSNSDIRIVLCSWGVCGMQPAGGVITHGLDPVDNSAGGPDGSVAFVPGVTHFTWDLTTAVAGDTEWSSGEFMLQLNAPGVRIFQHPDGPQTGAPSNEFLFPFSPALEFDTYFTAPKTIGPGQGGDTSTTLTASFMPGGAPTQLTAIWYSPQFPQPQGTIARFTIQVPPGSGIVPALVPTGLDGGKPILGSLHGNSIGRGSCDQPVAFSFDIIDSAAVGFLPPLETAAASAPVIEVLGDLDGDGDDDVIVALPAGAGNGDVQVFLNQGTASVAAGGWLGFAANPPAEVGENPAGIALADFNGDTFLDVAVANADGGDVSILLNDGLGTGTFVPAPSIAVGGTPGAIAAIDFDENTIPDLVVGDAADGTVTIFENDGSAAFAMGQSIDIGMGVAAMDPEDMDDDKCVDLVVADSMADAVVVLMNTDGTLAIAATLAVGDEPVDLATGDFDGDGLNDIATADRLGGTVSVILNDGGGVFQAAVPLGAGGTPQAVSAAAVDCGTSIDLVVVADLSAPDQIQVLLNLDAGPGSVAFDAPLAFSVSEDPGMPADPVWVVSGPLDQDALFDLVTSNTTAGGGSVSALLNRSVCGCPDADGSGDVNVVDLVAVILAWDTPGPEADFNKDGVVNVTDLLTVILGWGACSPLDFVCPGPGDCLVANGSPGCDLEPCCGLVCASDIYCCTVDWDQLCADEAYILCGGE